MNNNMNSPKGGYPQSPQKGAGLAIASMVLGIIALVSSCCLYFVAFPCSIIGVILAGVSLSKKSDGKGMAIAGLVTSLIALVPAIIVMVSGASLISSLSL